LKQRYTALLLKVEHHAHGIITLIVITVGIGLLSLFFLKNTFLPELREGHILVHANTVSGTSLTESLRLGTRMTKELLTVPGIRTVAQRVGRAENAEDTWGTHYTEFDIDLKPMPPEEAVKMEEKIRNLFAAYPYLNADVITYLSEHLMEAISGYKAPIVINIYGNDLDMLDLKAQEVADLLKTLPGARDVQFQAPPNIPELTIQLRSNDLTRWGFNPIDVLDVIRAAYQGEIVAQLPSGNQTVSVSVMLEPNSRNRVDQIKELPLRNASGTYIPLKKVADIYQVSGRYEVLHQGARRVQTVTANVSESDAKTFMENARKAINTKVSLPAGFYVEYSGTSEAATQSRNDLLLQSLFAGVGIILLLSVVMGNIPNLLLVLANLPFALVGGIIAVLVTGGEFSVGSMVGFVTLFGITLRNSIMMLSHYQHLVTEEGQAWGIETAIRGASERLVPILMTALVTGLGLLPLALGRNDPGREIEGTMAIVILGGLVTSTFLNLVILPTLSLRFGRFKESPQETD
jgi:Cu/Ag efflux pump CusA